MPALRQAWYTYRGFPSFMRGPGIRGVARQILAMVADSKRTTVDEIARRLVLPPERVAGICRSLSQGGYLIRSADEQGYAAAGEQEQEVLNLAGALRVFTEADISKKLEFSQEHAAELCRSLNRMLVRAPEGKYVLQKDLDAALAALTGGNGLDSEQLAARLGISASHAALLCRCLVERGSALESPRGGYVVPEGDLLRLVAWVNNHGEVLQAAIGTRLGLGPDYAKSLCSKAIEEGYLRSSPEGDYLYPND